MSEHCKRYSVFFSHVKVKSLIFKSIYFTLSVSLKALDLPQEALFLLKSDDFQKRERAQADLHIWSLKQPQSAMELLYEQTRASADPEVRERCLEVLRELVNNEYIKEGEGYIGIHMEAAMADVPGEPKPRVAIRVSHVIPDSAGAQAGMCVNDLIVELESQILLHKDLIESFSEKIRQLNPGNKIKLRILRNEQLFDVMVVLGKRPLFANTPFLLEYPLNNEAAEQAARDSYFRLWLERRKRLGFSK